jgi:hypothetical protein
LDHQPLVIEKHLYGRGNLAASEIKVAVQHPSRLGENEVRYPGAWLDEPLGRRDLFGIVACEESDEDVGINRAHIVS